MNITAAHTKEARRQRSVAACLQAHLFTRTCERWEHSERSSGGCAPAVVACCLTDLVATASAAEQTCSYRRREGTHGRQRKGRLKIGRVETDGEQLLAGWKVENFDQS